MVQINMTRDEKEAVNEIDRSQLQKLIDQCIYEERTGGIWALWFQRCYASVYEGASPHSTREFYVNFHTPVDKGSRRG